MHGVPILGLHKYLDENTKPRKMLDESIDWGIKLGQAKNNGVKNDISEYSDKYLQKRSLKALILLALQRGTV